MGDNPVTLVATDPHPQWETFANPASHQAQVSHSFNISVANVNDAPHVRGQGLRDRCVMRGGPGFELEVTAGGGDAPFDDIDFAVDPNEALTFAKTPGNIWPSWVDLNTDTDSIFSNGVPLEADLMSHTISVTATDQGGLSVDDSFNITVIEYNELAETQAPAEPLPISRPPKIWPLNTPFRAPLLPMRKTNRGSLYNVGRVMNNGSIASPNTRGFISIRPNESFLGHLKTRMWAHGPFG